MNAPDRLDSIVVPAGIPKYVTNRVSERATSTSSSVAYCRIQIVPDEKMSNAATYRVNREDHTIGHLMRMELLKHHKVRFAGYKHPHPLENDILIKIQTAPGYQPNAALSESAKKLEDMFALLQSDFRDQVRRLQAEEQQIGGATDGGMQY